MFIGQVGIDFAFRPKDRAGAPVSYATIAKDLGAANHARGGFVSRYSAGVRGAANPKTIREGEIQLAEHAGVDFAGNFELAEDTPVAAKLDAREGRRQGSADRQFYAARGYAKGAGVAVSWEPGNQRSRFDELARFLEGYRDGGGRPVGLYAGLPALLFARQHQLIDLTWLPMSAAASGIDTSSVKSQAEYAALLRQVATDNGINLCQNRNRWYPQPGGTFGADENIVTHPPAIPWTHLEALHAAQPDPPSPTPEPAPRPPSGRYKFTLYTVHGGAGPVFGFAAGYWRELLADEVAALIRLHEAPAEIVQVRADTLLRLKHVAIGWGGQS